MFKKTKMIPPAGATNSYYIEEQRIAVGADVKEVSVPPQCVSKLLTLGFQLAPGEAMPYPPYAQEEG